MTPNTILSIQAGAEGRTDPTVPDVPPRFAAALDRGGGFSAQDAAGDRLPREERPDLHPPARAHRQGPQAAGGRAPLVSVSAGCVSAAFDLFLALRATLAG